MTGTSDPTSPPASPPPDASDEFALGALLATVKDKLSKLHGASDTNHAAQTALQTAQTDAANKITAVQAAAKTEIESAQTVADAAKAALDLAHKDMDDAVSALEGALESAKAAD